jgi:hypothetical protein
MNKQIDFVWASTKERTSLLPLYEKALSFGWDTNFIKVKKPWFFKPSKPYRSVSALIVISHDMALSRLQKKGWKGEYIYIEHGLSPVKYYTYKYNFFHASSLLFYPGTIFKRKMDAINPEFKVGLLGGYPKCDELVSMKPDKSSLIEYYDLDKTQPIILFAPSWGAKLGAGITNVSHLKDIPNVVVAPHPSEYKLADQYGVKLPPKAGNINELLHLADIVISDVSSIVAEAALIGKTTVQLELPDYPGCFPSPEKRKSGIWIDEEVIRKEENETDREKRPFKIPYIDDDWCFGYSCKPKDLKMTVEEALVAPDRHKELAARKAEESCYKCDGNISERILKMIEKYSDNGKYIQL